MFDRKELLQSKEYWLTRIQTKLYSLFEKYMDENNLTRKDFADELEVSKGYVSQILNGNFDHRLSKFIELSLAINKIPQIYFEDIDQVLEDDELGLLYEEEKNNRPVINLEVNFEPYNQKVDSTQKKRIKKEKLDESEKSFSYLKENFSEPQEELLS